VGGEVLGDVEDLEFVGLLAEALDALEGESVVGDEELFEVEVVEEHLLQSLVRYVVVDEVQDAQALREILGDVEEQVVVYLAAVELQVHQVGEGL
jgi:superfamily I DNA/RNA helicase